METETEVSQEAVAMLLSMAAFSDVVVVIPANVAQAADWDANGPKYARASLAVGVAMTSLIASTTLALSKAGMSKLYRASAGTAMFARCASAGSECGIFASEGATEAAVHACR